MNARRVAKELEYHTKGLNRNLPAVPPTLTKEETKQVELWKRFITYEKSNPLRTEDTALVTRRVMFATEQCLLVLTHHPAVWHQASQFLDTSARFLTDKGVRSRRSHTHKGNTGSTSCCCCCCFLLSQIEKAINAKQKTQNSCLSLLFFFDVKCRPLGNAARGSSRRKIHQQKNSFLSPLAALPSIRAARVLLSSLNELI